MSHFQTIGIIGKKGQTAEVKATLDRLVTYLRSRQCEVFFDAVSGAMLAQPRKFFLTDAQMGKRCSLAVVVGGDGTLLRAARSLAKFGVPLVGINLGRLGFLVDISPAEIETCLDRILAGEYDEEARAMLAATIGGKADAAPTHLALNDVVIHKWDRARMIEFETSIDGVFVNTQSADGLIVATPTGSTAYAMSGGGPLLHPSLDALVLVPICPHALSNRPLVVAGGSRIEIRVCGFDTGHVQVTCDGQTTLALALGTRVHVGCAPYPARLLHPKGHDHYAILRAKLGWGGYLPRSRTC